MEATDSAPDPSPSPSRLRALASAAPHSRGNRGVWLWLAALLPVAATFGWAAAAPSPFATRLSVVAALVWVLLLSLVVHELGHGLTAELCGDDTARRLGRLSLDPRAHLDWLSSFWMPAVTGLVLAVTGVGVVVGWARPIPSAPSRFVHPTVDSLRVAAGGPVATAVALYLSLLGVVALELALARLAPQARMVLTPGSLAGWLDPALQGGAWTWTFAATLLRWGMLVNTVLLTVNLIPVVPLDGGWIARLLLPRPARTVLEFLQAPALVLLALLALAGGGLITLPAAALWQVLTSLVAGATGALP